MFQKLKPVGLAGSEREGGGAQAGGVGEWGRHEGRPDLIGCGMDDGLYLKCCESR